MSGDGRTTLVSARVSPTVVRAIAEFRDAEGLTSQSDAVRLLIEIALDTISNQGNRFWDKSPAAKPTGKLPRG
jgi:hypothetical protein